jgi:hypothetical protein
MIVPDFINGSLEFIGGLFWWSNVKRLLKDKTIQGVNWSTQAFFTGWGVWNLYYYPTLHQWASFTGGIFLVLGNGTWVTIAVYYERKNK